MRTRINSFTARKKESSLDGGHMFCFLLMMTAVQAFAPATNYHNYAKSQSQSSSSSSPPLHTLYAHESSGKVERGLLQLLNDEVGDLILDRLNEKIYGEMGAKKSSTHNRNTSKKLGSGSGSGSSATDGLSKFHRSMLSTTSKRQRCVTGQYPLKIRVQENPTRKWLSGGSASVATSQMLVNGTSVERSLASYDRFQWLEDDERTALHEGHTLFSLELLAEINIKKPGYINILPASDAGFLAKREKEEAGVWKNQYRLTYDQRNSNGENDSDSDNGMYASSKNELAERTLEKDRERVWITGFSLTKQSGEVHYVDVESGAMGHINKQTASDIRWPNEVNAVPVQNYNNGFDPIDVDVDMEIMKEDALLVSDGFLVPGRDNGGVYVVSRPGERNEWRVCLAGGNGMDGLLNRLETRRSGMNEDTSVDGDGWFYHRSIWIDLTMDGRQSVLTARAKRPSLLKEENDSSQLPTKAQLVWLERPQPHSYDKATGTPLDKDGLVFDPFSPKHVPWKLRVLDEGPDVMFSVADLDTTGKTIMYP